MSAMEEFASWRVRNPEAGGWGLAWFLGNEFCRRFHASHGIRPTVINHDGLGYYGIGLEPVACHVNGAAVDTLGRLTIEGDVENWRSGDPGDHRLETVAMCRHQRWGASYALCFELATVLALKHPMGRVAISNAAEEVDRKLVVLDAKANMTRHPGAFLFRREEREVLLAGDGRLLGESPLDLWQLHMQGKGVAALAGIIEERIGT